MTGNHRSRRVGSAIEFADFQEYVPGADLRFLDWKVLARSDRAVIKRFEVETELPCTVVVDLSGDVATGLSGAGGYPELDASKAGYAITMAATLLYYLQRQGERIGLTIIAGEGESVRLPPRGGRTQLQQCFLALARAVPGGVAGLGAALTEVGSRVPRRSLVVVISDGMEEPDSWLPSLSAFGRRGTDLRFVHLRDEGEFTLDFSEAAVFYSPETGAELSLDPVAAREAFEEVAREYVQQVYGGVVRWGGAYVPAITSRSLETTLRKVIAGRAVSPEQAWG